MENKRFFFFFVAQVSPYWFCFCFWSLLMVQVHPIPKHLWSNLVNNGINYQPQLSHEKNPGCLGDIGDYTTQLYGDYNKPL